MPAASCPRGKWATARGPPTLCRVGTDPDETDLSVRARGQRIAGFELIQRIDTGANNAFGEVWLAKRLQPFQRVAIKFLRRDRVNEEMVERFSRAESKALARFNHPYIARFYELGFHGPVPYLVMQYVPGDRITAYADKHRLSVAERLRLMAKVCDAVQHVHLQGVVHRDLKPANILVSESRPEAEGVQEGEGRARTEEDSSEGRGPIPVLIDFGLAKSSNPEAPLTSAVVSRGGMAGTPAYASPEQIAARHAEDTGQPADIYALGAVLFELVAGVSPMEHVLSDTTLSEPERLARLAKDERPGMAEAYAKLTPQGQRQLADARGIGVAEMHRLLRSRLAHLTDRALRHDPGSRFSDARALALDIGNYLSDRDYLEAAAEPRVEKWRRAVRRNRVVVGAVAAVMLSLTVGLMLALWGQTRAEHEARRAERLLSLSGELLEQLFGDDTGSNASLIPILDRLEPEVRAGLDAEDFMPQLATIVASGLRKVGRAQQAALLANDAVRRMRTSFGPDDRRTIEAENSAIILQIAALEDFESDPDPSRAATRGKTLESALASQRDVADRAGRSLGPTSELALAAAFNAAGIEMQLGRQEEAVAECRKLLPIARQALDPRSGVLADARLLYCVALQASSPLNQRGDEAVARRYMQDALEEYASMRLDFERTFGPKDARTLRAAADHAMLLFHLDRRQDARRIHEAIIPHMRLVLGDANGATLGAMEAHAENLTHLGDRRAAAEFLGAVLPAIRWSGGGRSEQVAHLESLASELAQQNAQPSSKQ